MTLVARLLETGTPETPKAAEVRSEPTPEQQNAYNAIPICRVCAERHPFICPYIRKVVLDAKGDFRVIDLRDEFFSDYLPEVPHGPADLEVA